MYYAAESENGDRTVDPSEDALFMIIEDLNGTDNTFVVVEPPDPVWFATVGVLEEGGYEVVLRDSRRNVHAVSTSADVGAIAKDLTVWMAGRTSDSASAT